MQQASETGSPAFRPLLLEYPDDPATYERDDEFLFGSDLLVAPALREPATERDVYLPAGDWYDFWTGKRYDGGKGMKVPLTLDKIPVFVRGGAFVFRQPVVQHTGQMSGQPLIVDVYPAARSEASYYEDDGATLEYSQGTVFRRAFRQSREEGRCVIDVGLGAGSYRPAPRDLVLRVRFDDIPRHVRVGSESLAPTNTAIAGLTGWSRMPDGVVTIRMPDRFDAMQVTIER
jgi:alpha-glucosidase